MLKIHISGTELSNSKKQGIKQQQIQEIFPQIVTVRGEVGWSVRWIARGRPWKSLGQFVAKTTRVAAMDWDGLHPTDSPLQERR